MRAASSIEAAVRVGTSGEKIRSSSSEASPIATTAASRGAAAASGVRSTPFARPPAMSTTRSRPSIAAERRVRVGRLGVVDESDATRLRHGRSAVRERRADPIPEETASADSPKESPAATAATASPRGDLGLPASERRR
jgi:hypothetical protein